jgi:hypothetical protein
MALTLKKIASLKHPSQPSQPLQPSPQPESASEMQPSQPTGAKWYKRGDEVQTALKQEEHRIEQKFSALWRWYLDKGETGSLTFVDGFLTKHGILDCFMYREHQIYMNGRWTNWFPCTSESEPCPICESGDEPSLVGVFTVIDHREIKGKKGVYKDTRKLFVAKRVTLKQLQMLASSRNGLAGCTFTVSRVGEQAPNVGDVFDFQKKRPIDELRKLYVRKVKTETGAEEIKTLFVPADYEKEIVYLSAAELRKMGFGKGSPIGSESGPKDIHGPAVSSVADELG